MEVYQFKRYYVVAELKAPAPNNLRDYSHLKLPENLSKLQLSRNPVLGI